MTGVARLALLGVAALGCARTTELFPELTAACTAPGPVVHLGGTDDASCAGAIAARLGRYALCTCKDLIVTGNLNVGVQGMGPAPPPPGVPPSPVFLAPVGTDGNVQVSGMTRIKGSLVSSGTEGAFFMRGGSIDGNVHVGGALTTASMMDLFIAGDAYANGDVSGRFLVNGALHVPDVAAIAPATRAREIVREQVAVDDPCPCSAGPAFDVGAAVAARKARNANDALAFPVSLLAGASSNLTLEWGCGEYYVPEISSGDSAALTFRVHGHVAIFVEGDVQLGNNLLVDLDAGAELDLVVTKSFDMTGRVFGSPSSAARTRLWVGGPTVSLPDQVQFGAAVYAPAAVVTAGAGLTFTGTLFAATLAVGGDVRITYDQAATAAGESCGVAAPDPVQ
jgi:hypothetical protein